MLTNSEIGILVVTTITAIATSISAYVSWRLWQGRIFPEWEFSWSGDGRNRELYVRVEIQNNTHSTFQAISVEIPKAPILNLDSGNREEKKHESWGLRKAPLSRAEIRPNSSKTLSFHILLDWEALSTKPSRRLITRSVSDAPLRIQIMLAAKSSRRRKITFNNKINIPRAMIETTAREIST